MQSLTDTVSVTVINLWVSLPTHLNEIFQKFYIVYSVTERDIVMLL